MRTISEDKFALKQTIAELGYDIMSRLNTTARYGMVDKLSD